MPPVNGNDSLVHTFQIDLSLAIKIEKRVVTSLLSLFGEIGGLNDFMAAFILIFIGNI